METDKAVSARGRSPSGRAGEPRSKWRPRWFIAGPVAVLVGAIFVGGLAETASSMTVTIALGRGTAAFHWKSVRQNPDGFNQPPQPFKGVAAGISVSGDATMPFTTFNPPPANPTAPILVQLVNWEGTLGREPFDVAIFASYPNQQTYENPTILFPKITFFGAWGNELVLGSVVTPSRAELKSGNGPLRFRGTIGDLNVVGKVLQPTSTRHRGTGSATFVVSR